MIMLSEMNPGEQGIVSKIDAQGELKQRLFSLGLRKGSQIKMKASSISKSTLEVEVGSTLLALRYEEAKMIQVRV
ncbi:MAG: ferrous iron transport protein A [Campylobacterales bacterium]|nr:ferrous iron transport protein A [Campylobacterales bacterium]MBN2831810.1 ferrous iron transport protein A [Campylobacterales bacterium]